MRWCGAMLPDVPWGPEVVNHSCIASPGMTEEQQAEVAAAAAAAVSKARLGQMKDMVFSASLSWSLGCIRMRTVC